MRIKISHRHESAFHWTFELIKLVYRLKITIVRVNIFPSFSRLFLFLFFFNSLFSSFTLLRSTLFLSFSVRSFFFFFVPSFSIDVKIRAAGTLSPTVKRRGWKIISKQITTPYALYRSTGSYEINPCSTGVWSGASFAKLQTSKRSGRFSAQ